MLNDNYFINNFFILLRLCLFKKLGNERISDILVKLLPKTRSSYLRYMEKFL